MPRSTDARDHLVDPHLDGLCVDRPHAGKGFGLPGHRGDQFLRPCSPPNPSPGFGSPRWPGRPKTLPGMSLRTAHRGVRIDEMVAGIRANLGIKLYGESLETLKAKAEEIEKVIKAIPGVADTTYEQVTGLPVLRCHVQNEALSPLRRGPAPAGARYGSKPLAATGGEIIEPGRRFPLHSTGMAYGEDPMVYGTDLHHDRVPGRGHRSPYWSSSKRETDHRPSNGNWGERRDHGPDENVGGDASTSFVKEPQERIGRDVFTAGRLHESNGVGSSRVWSGPNGDSTSWCRWPPGP